MTIPANLQNKLDNLPSSPGVYLMKDSRGKILYVGKGKDLRKRVLSYFREKDHYSAKIRILVKKLSDLEFIITGSERHLFLSQILSNTTGPDTTWFSGMTRDTCSCAWIPRKTIQG